MAVQLIKRRHGNTTASIYLLSELPPQNESESVVNPRDALEMQMALASKALDEQMAGELLRNALVADGYTVPASSPETDFNTYCTQHSIPVKSMYYVLPNTIFMYLQNGRLELAEYMRVLSASREARKRRLYAWMYLHVHPAVVAALEAQLSTSLSAILRHHIDVGRLGVCMGDASVGVLDFVRGTAGTIFESNNASTCGMDAAQRQIVEDFFMYGEIVRR